MIIGAAPSLTVSPGQILGGRLAVKGWCSGASIDSQDTLAFSALTGVRSMNETFPLERAAEAYLRAHAERPGAVSRRPHDGRLDADSPT